MNQLLNAARGYLSYLRDSTPCYVRSNAEKVRMMQVIKLWIELLEETEEEWVLDSGVKKVGAHFIK